MKFILIAMLVAIAAAQEHGNHNNQDNHENNGHHNQDHTANQHAIEGQLRHIFDHMDTDGDGRLSLAEDNANFDRIDADGDGQITCDEFVAYRRQAHGPLHSTEEQLRATCMYYDTRGGTQAADGLIKRDDVQYFFYLQDGNVDGHISLQEFEAGLQQMVQAISHHLPTAAGTTAAP